MNYCKTLSLLLLLYSIGHLSQRLTAASPEGKSDEVSNTAQELVQQTSPSPSPAAGNSNLDYGVKPTTGQETCELVSNKCHENDMNVTACVLPYAGDGPGPIRLLVLNEGDDSLKFNVTILPSKPGSDNIEVSGHEVKKINVSASASSTSSIVLKAVNWTCTIQLPVPVPVGFPFPSYASYVTPVNGAYVLLATASLIGLMWACCKLGKNKRQLDGIPYQELEMGEQQSTPSINVETATAWDQDWDDDWDEEKAVKSPSGSRIGNRRANGSSRFAESNGWGED